MPYANIHWIKLKLEILNDKRFLFDLDDNQKLLFLGLIILAGATKNNVPDDENFIKNRLNMSENTQNIRKNLQKIYEVFPKTVSINGVVKFKNFNKLHNPLKELQRNSDGTPKDTKSRVDIEKIIREYIYRKKFPITNDDGSINTALRNALWKRHCRPAKNLLVMAKDNVGQIIEAMNWFGDICDKKGYSWTLETIEKWFPEYLVRGKTDDYVKLLEKFNLQKR